MEDAYSALTGAWINDAVTRVFSWEVNTAEWIAVGPGWREGNNIYSMKGHAGGCEPWVPLGTVTENKVPTTTGGGTGRESTGLSKRKSVLKMPVQFPVWHRGAPNMRRRRIKMGFRRRTLDNLTLRTPVGYSKEDAQCMGERVEVCWSGASVTDGGLWLEGTVAP